MGGVELRGEELLAWRGMLRIVVRTRRELGRRLQEGHGLTMAEYDALVPVAAAPGGRVRMAELAEVILQPRSSTTRLVEGLVRRGYLRRTPASRDGRGVEAVLTDDGRAAFAAAHADHHANVRELVTGHLTPAQLTALAGAWRAVDPEVDDR